MEDEPNDDISSRIEDLMGEIDRFKDDEKF